MFNSTTKRLGIGGLIGGGILGLMLTFGGNITSQAVDIWRKDASGVVRVFPTSLEINVGESKLTAATTTVKVFTQGGGQCTITDANGGTITLTEAQLIVCNYLYMTASGAGQEVIALTLPATSTMTTLIPNVGNYREWLIDASDLAAATTTTITLGTGIDLIAVTNAEDVIDGAEYSELRCWRKSDTDVTCITSELVDAD